MNDKVIAVLGGAGYIGSHTCLTLSAHGYTPLIIDNLSNGHRAFCLNHQFKEADVLETDKLAQIFKEHKPEAIIHFAAFIEVADSVVNPEKFYRNNVEGTRSVLSAMQSSGIEHIVFSSTAAVYGQPETDVPIAEDSPIAPINPYGKTKVAAENLIRDASGISSVCLRYFNAAGADGGGTLGEAHFPESHLIPLVLHTALGWRDYISVYGEDYPTKDGSCIRDYIHVNDLADAHVKALEHLLRGGDTMACNLGTGKGHSVREIVDMVGDITQIDFDVRSAPARAGDPAFLVADNAKAKKVLGWAPTRTLEDIIRNAYKWHNSDLYKALYESHSLA